MAAGRSAQKTVSPGEAGTSSVVFPSVLTCGGHLVVERMSLMDEGCVIDLWVLLRINLRGLFWMHMVYAEDRLGPKS